LNLAVADVAVLAGGLAACVHTGDETLLEAYPSVSLERDGRPHHFSWWVPSMPHRPADPDPLTGRLQLAQLRDVTRSTAAGTWLAENYTGLPLPESIMTSLPDRRPGTSLTS